MKRILLAAILSTIALLSAVAEERIGIDPVLRGLWRLHVTSTDSGVTLDMIDPPEDFAIVTATAINLGAGERFTFERVLISEDNEGNPANMVLLNTGRWLAITKRPGQPYVLVQAYEMTGDTAIEHQRWLVTVHE